MNSQTLRGNGNVAKGKLKQNDAMLRDDNLRSIKSRFLTTCALTCVLALGGLYCGCAGGPTSDSTGQYVDDATITTKVKSALLGDGAVKSFEIKVETFKGIVQLSGFVDTEDQRAAATRDAMAVGGVKDVNDSLTLK
jgi:hyperosmotically inducible protein